VPAGFTSRSRLRPLRFRFRTDVLSNQYTSSSAHFLGYAKEPTQGEEYLYQSRSACFRTDNPSSHYRACPDCLLTKTPFGTYQQPVFAASRKFLIYLVSDYLTLYGVRSVRYSESLVHPHSGRSKEDMTMAEKFQIQVFFDHHDQGFSHFERRRVKSERRYSQRASVRKVLHSLLPVAESPT